MSDPIATVTDEGEEREGLTRVEVAYEAIVEAIVTRRLIGGDVIQEAKVAQSLGLSRTPVREAMGRLEGEGLLLRRGRVVVVRSVTVTEYLEALHVRRLIELDAVGLACDHVPLFKLKDLHAKLSALTDPTGITPAEHWQIDDELHDMIAQASGNELMAEMVANLRLKTRLFNLKKVPDRFIPGRDEHLRIVEALMARDTDAAREAMRVHLDNVKQGILSVISF